jgi:hypothetical protein
LAVAVIAAAVADPIVEFASNAGWFGPGNFTDRSNLDVFPALVVGLGALALYLIGRAPAILAGTALPRRLVSLVPAIFVLQIAVLYVMETAEQFIVGGHTLGPVVWLGGPITASLAIHAALCVTVTFWIAIGARAGSNHATRYSADQGYRKFRRPCIRDSDAARLGWTRFPATRPRALPNRRTRAPSLLLT